jgi:hypothetical protein
MRKVVAHYREAGTAPDVALVGGGERSRQQRLMQLGIAADHGEFGSKQ